MRPDALKRLMSNIDGRAIEVSSVELARSKLNWPRGSIKPPASHVMKASADLYVLKKNPPEGFIIKEVPGTFVTVRIEKAKEVAEE